MLYVVFLFYWNVIQYFLLQIFIGNLDGILIVKNQLMNVMNVRYICFYFKKWYICVCVRIELYGCKGKIFFMLLYKLINFYYI